MMHKRRTVLPHLGMSTAIYLVKVHAGYIKHYGASIFVFFNQETGNAFELFFDDDFSKIKGNWLEEYVICPSEDIANGVVK